MKIDPGALATYALGCSYEVIAADHFGGERQEWLEVATTYMGTAEEHQAAFELTNQTRARLTTLLDSLNKLLQRRGNGENRSRGSSD